MNATFASVVSLAVTACVFGGPSRDPTLTGPLPEASAAASGGSTASGGSAASGGSESVPPPSTSGAGGASAINGGTGSGSSGAPCQATVPVCDPVHNTGCLPLQQCDVDSLQAQTPTGRCVFHDALATTSCATTIVSQSCEPGNTCVEGACRALCHCDADCLVEQCCNEAVGAAGFRLCQPCK